MSTIFNEKNLNILKEQANLQDSKIYDNHLLKLSLLNSVDNHGQESKKIVYFTGYSKDMISFDLNTLKTTKDELFTNEEISSCICMCRMPDDSLFCFENIPQSNSAFLVDPSLKITYMDSCIPYYCSGSIYHNSHIYAFGGSSPS